MITKYKTKMTPLNDRVVVKRDTAEKLSAGGILIPHADKEKTISGIVVAVGPGRTLDSGVVVPTGVAVGQKIIFGKYTPNEIKVDGEDFIVIRSEDIHVVVETK